MGVRPNGVRRRSAAIWAATFLFLAIASSPTSLLAQEDEATFRELEQATEACRLRIDEELAELRRDRLADDDWAKEWAGVYDSLGAKISLHLAPRTGISYASNSCMGIIEANHGDIAAVGEGWLDVSWAFDPAKSHRKYVSSKLYFVRWGERRYLVPDVLMNSFLSNYNCGGYDRERMYDIPRLRQGRPLSANDSDPEPPGRPELPAAFAHRIIEKPVSMKIAAVTNVRKHERKGSSVVAFTADVELAAGSDDGLSAGLRIGHMAGVPEGFIDLLEVSATTSRGRYVEFSLDNKTPKLPQVGSEIFLPGAKSEIAETRNIPDPAPGTDSAAQSPRVKITAGPAADKTRGANEHERTQRRFRGR